MTNKINLNKINLRKLEHLQKRLEMTAGNVQSEIRYIPETGEGCIVCRRVDDLNGIVKFAVSRGLEAKVISEDGMLYIKLFTP